MVEPSGGWVERVLKDHSHGMIGLGWKEQSHGMVVLEGSLQIIELWNSLAGRVFTDHRAVK